MTKPKRSIPAWAGETSSIQALCAVNPVYPRVGGGNPRPPIAASAQAGLSPRGRGKLILLSICITSSSVYPRVGGGN